MSKHNRTTLLISLLCAVFLGFCAPAGAEEVKEAPFLLGEEYILSAEKTTFVNGSVHAVGTVRFQTGNVEVAADDLTIDINRGMVEARGKVTLTSPGNQMTGDDLVYYWRENKGSLRHISLENEGYWIQAESGDIDLASGNIVLKKASFTRCELAKPDYRFLAGGMMVKENRLLAQGVSLELFGQRLVPLLPLTIPVAPERLRTLAQKHLPLPVIAPDGDHGIVAEMGQMYPLDDRTLMVGGLGYSSESGIQLKADLFHLLGKDGLLEVKGDYQPVSGQGFLATQVQWPETNGYLIRGEWGTQKVTAADNLEYRLYYWPHLVLAIPPLQTGLGSINFRGDTGRLTETGEATASVVSSAFSQVRLDVGMRPVTFGGLTLKGSGSLEQDWYGTGDRRTLGETQVAVEKPVFPGVTLELVHNWRQMAGVTPFMSQDVSSLRALDLGLDMVILDGDLNGSLRYDLDRGLFSEVTARLDYQITRELKGGAGFTYLLPEQQWSEAKLSLSKDMHCFDIGVTYDVKDRQLGATFHYKI